MKKFHKVTIFLPHGETEIYPQIPTQGLIIDHEKGFITIQMTEKTVQYGRLPYRITTWNKKTK